MATYTEPIAREDGTYKTKDKCLLCEENKLATLWRICWECKRHETTTSPELRSTEKWNAQAKRDWDQVSCLHQRAIVPKQWINDISEGPGNEGTWCTAGFLNKLNNNRWAYTDGAGANTRTTPKQCVKTGFGAITFDYDEEVGYSSISNTEAKVGGTPGKQTIPMAELTGANNVAEELDPDNEC